ncbi:hypothetical protein J6590_098992 [Homalodisca vitripennis]|nr:hypothetical protein J6590_098992 [Homalodisca vitripennis]
MERPHPGGTAFVITVTPTPGNTKSDSDTCTEFIAQLMISARDEAFRDLPEVKRPCEEAESSQRDSSRRWKGARGLSRRGFPKVESCQRSGVPRMLRPEPARGGAYNWPRGSCRNQELIEAERCENLTGRTP